MISLNMTPSPPANDSPLSESPWSAPRPALDGQVTRTAAAKTNQRGSRTIPFSCWHRQLYQTIPELTTSIWPRASMLSTKNTKVCTQ